MKRVEIEWIDPVSAYNEWYSLEELKESCPCSLSKSIGYLVAEDKDFVWIAIMYISANKGGGTRARGISVIPRHNILKMTELRK